MGEKMKRKLFVYTWYVVYMEHMCSVDIIVLTTAVSYFILIVVHLITFTKLFDALWWLDASVNWVTVVSDSSLQLFRRQYLLIINCTIGNELR